MPIHELAEMTWEEFRDAGAAAPVAVLPVGALEAHGPHLPLATDVLIARAMAEEGARRLSAAGATVLLLPPLAYTTAVFAAAFPGTISIRPEAVTELVVDLASSLARHGVRLLAIANAHLDPSHLAALRRAGERLAEAGGATLVFPDLTRRRLAERLGEEFASGACHAGRFEGSIVLACRPDLVREAVRRALPPNPASLSDAIRAGRTTFEEAGGPDAYFGWPADATAEEGRRMIALLGAILAEAVSAARSTTGEPPAASASAPEPRP